MKEKIIALRKDKRVMLVLCIIVMLIGAGACFQLGKNIGEVIYYLEQHVLQ